MRIKLILGQSADLGFQLLTALVEIPEFPARDIRVVGVGKGNSQAPWTAALIVVFAAEMIELLVGEEGDLVVIFHLVSDLGDPCTGDRAEIVVPPVDPL